MSASRKNESSLAMFREFSRVLHWGPSHRIAMFSTYFDESGLHKKSPDILEWLVLGGAIATQAV